MRKMTLQTAVALMIALSTATMSPDAEASNSIFDQADETIAWGDVFDDAEDDQARLEAGVEAIIVLYGVVIQDVAIAAADIDRARGMRDVLQEAVDIVDADWDAAVRLGLDVDNYDDTVADLSDLNAAIARFSKGRSTTPTK